MLFQDQTKGQNTDQTNQAANQEDWLAKVVEAKGESFKDVQVLAKSKLESDAYIKQLEEQAKALREEVAKQDYSAELLKQLQNKAPNPTNGNPVVPKDNNGSTNSGETKPEVSEDAVKALVEKALAERQQESAAKENARVVQEALVEKYGTEAKAHVEGKARELGISYDKLEALALESPNAFLTLIGEPKVAPKTIVSGTVNTQSLAQTNPNTRDWNYYQNIRRSNRSLYFSPAIQQQMFNDKLALGDKFGN